MEITIHDVASRAGVSVSTASRILNGGTKGMRRDAAERARKVVEAAKELGYHPNTTARGLVMKRSFTLGFLATELSNPVRAQLVEKLRGAAMNKGYHLLVSGVQYGEDISKALNNLTSRQIDGLILGNIQKRVMNKHVGAGLRNIPITGFGEETDTPWDSVIINYPAMARELALHLIKDHGFKHIAYASMSPQDSRGKSFLKTIDEAGLIFGGHWITESLSLAGGRNIAKKMIAEGSRPEAVVCHNDLLAIGIIAGLRDLNIRVPEDIAVVGLDNIDMANYTNPALTTIGVDPSELADKLFNLLLDRIENKFSGSPRREPCHEKMFIRESCGCRRN